MSSIKKLLETAQKEIGYLEKKNKNYLDEKIENAGNKNYTKYARDLDNILGFYNGKKQGFAWCDVFVDWCFVETFGVDNAKKLLCQPNNSLGAGVGFSKNYFVKNKQYHKNNPNVGDQIFFKQGSKIVHTGLVFNVDKNYVYTIEGNTSNSSSVVANGGEVCSKKYKLNNTSIDGYGRPNYSALDINGIDKYEVFIKYVSNVDYEGLNVRDCPNGKIVGKPITVGTQLTIYENKDNWSRIGDNKWVCSSYLLDKKPDTKIVFGADTEGLNVRKIRSTKNNKPITFLKNGTVVQVFKTINGWSKISPDNEAWVSSSNLR